MREKMTIAAVVVGAVALAVAAVPAVQAHKGATGVVMERMMAMKDMGAIMKEWGAIRKGKGAFKAERVREQAVTLKGHAADMAKLFPKGSIKGPSEATPAIWENWAGFSGIAKELETYAGQLGGPASAQMETAVPLFVKIGGTCGTCHKVYRKEEK